MAKKSQPKTTVQEMSVEELQARLRETEESNFRLRFRHASNPLKNPMDIRTTRREIARIKTVLNQKTREAV